MRYRRVYIPGGVYFFTLTLAERRGNDLLLRHIDPLRDALRRTKSDHPFAMDAVCIVPEHLHCIWRLPEGDANFSMRWALIKQRFSRTVPVGERVSASLRRKGERGIWQRRYHADPGHRADRRRARRRRGPGEGGASALDICLRRW